jgi:hypothetical protein
MSALPQRFWSKVDRGGPVPPYASHLGACWLWLASIGSHGYGQFNEGPGPNGTKLIRSAHRLTWEDANGPVPVGLELDHLCRVRSCCRPTHLETVSRIENVRRGGAGRHNAIKTHCKQGHPFDELNTAVYVAHTGTLGRACRACHNAAGRRRRAVARANRFTSLVSR